MKTNLSRMPSTDRNKRLQVLFGVLLCLGLLATAWNVNRTIQTHQDVKEARSLTDESEALIARLKSLQNSETDSRIVAEEGFLAYPYIREIAQNAELDVALNFETIDSYNYGESGIVEQQIEIRFSDSVLLDEFCALIIALAESEVPMRCTRIDLASDSTLDQVGLGQLPSTEMWRVERLVISYLVVEPNM